MSRTKKGNPYLSGIIVVTPPGKASPSESGYTPIWEEDLGLLYVSNKEATTVDLSVGKEIRFNFREGVMASKAKVSVAYNIKNV